jgi:homoserine O-acetyltransferase
VERIMTLTHLRAAAGLAFGLLLSGSMLVGVAYAQSSSPSAPADGRPAAQWDQRVNPAAVQADAWFDNYKFRDGETLPRLKIHYATLGAPHRDANGDIDNAVLVLHWTGADSRALLSPTYTKALFDPGRALDATRYYLIFPDSVGHGQSTKPSDGLRAKFPNL